mgnify:FL=1|jgi:hypothetical protein
MNRSERFMAAFTGFSAAHGQTQISDERRAGKQKAKSRIVRQPLTLELIKQHLEGKNGVGSIPINEDNQCKFGALDIDKYPLDIEALDRKLRKMEVPCITCRSKSGGAHIFFFFTKWISAGEFRDKASEISAVLGYGGCEIFPKQEQILVERGDVGNFINLPYFDEEQTLRYAVKEDGEAASLDEFLELVDRRSVDPDVFVGLTFGEQVDEFKDWAPCLSCMFGQGIPEGTRNTVMFAAAVGCKKEQPENWKARLEEINSKFANPALPASEIVTIQQQHEKKEYGFPCDQEPLKSYCNKTLCKTKKFGIGSHVSNIDVTGLCVVKSEPPVWFCDVGGQRVELDTDDLQTPQRFQKACMEQIHKMPPMMKMADWQVIVGMLMEDMSEIDVPEELTYKGQFMDLLEAFCDGRVQAQSAEEISLGKPYTDEDESLTYFKIEALMKFLRNQRFDSYSRGQIQERLKELNGDGLANGLKRFKTTKGDSKPLRVWWVPAFNREVQVPRINVEGDGVPF